MDRKFTCFGSSRLPLEVMIILAAGGKSPFGYILIKTPRDTKWWWQYDDDCYEQQPVEVLRWMGCNLVLSWLGRSWMGLLLAPVQPVEVLSWLGRSSHWLSPPRGWLSPPLPASPHILSALSLSWLPSSSSWSWNENNKYANQKNKIHQPKHQACQLKHQVCQLKGIVHNFFLYRSNLIFWIVMGCGIADFGRRGL